MSIRLKVAVIVGSSRGIGEEIAVQLCAKRFHVVLTSESGSRATEERICSRVEGASVETLQVDLSLVASTKAFAEQVKSKHEVVHVLVNNATAHAATTVRTTTEEGLETTFATMVLPFFMLPLLLLPNLENAALQGSLLCGARAINVSTVTTGDEARLVLEDHDWTHRHYDVHAAERQCQTAVNLLTITQAARLDESDVTVNSVLIGSENCTGGPSRREYSAGGYKSSSQTSVESAADTVAWLACAAEVQGITGTFFREDREVPLRVITGESAEEQQDALWEMCAHATQVGL